MISYEMQAFRKKKQYFNIEFIPPTVHFCWTPSKRGYSLSEDHPSLAADDGDCVSMGVRVFSCARRCVVYRLFCFSLENTTMVVGLRRYHSPIWVCSLPRSFRTCAWFCLERSGLVWVLLVCVPHVTVSEFDTVDGKKGLSYRGLVVDVGWQILWKNMFLLRVGLFKNRIQNYDTDFRFNKKNDDVLKNQQKVISAHKRHPISIPI